MTRTGKAARLATTCPSRSSTCIRRTRCCAACAKASWRASPAAGARWWRACFGGGIPRGSVFVPIHWNDQFSSDARVGAVVNPAVDPVSGEPEFKHTPVRVEEFRVSWHGFVLSRQALAPTR
jgi:assimilatory nitrate reductase catalytic subunit